MANTSSAKKAVRKLARRTAVNRMRRSAMRTQLRKVEEAIAAGDAARPGSARRTQLPTGHAATPAGDAATARAVLATTESVVMRSAQKGVIHANAASRKVARLSARVKALSATAAVAAG